jgi:oligopeptide/dipeptide ABC transporter ATP-binding protein
MLLDVQNLSVEYVSVGARNRAVNDLSFLVAPGEVVGIVGESGCGKSTAILAVLGLTRPGGRIVQGSVKFEDTELLGASETAWRSVRGAQIAVVTQNPRASLNPMMRVGEQIVTAYRAHRVATPEEARERALELLRVVGINDPERRLQAFPHELSGGMAQRVLIAMALSCSPKLLMADEPTSGLDVTIQAQVLDDLRRAIDEVRSSLLLVSQDLGIVANYCDRVYLLHAGEVAEEAATVDFFGQPAHPAAVALLSVQRRMVAEGFRLRGLPIDGRRLPRGCYLHPRCPFSDLASGCESVHPPLFDVAPGHRSRCHRFAAVHAAAVSHFDKERMQPAKEEAVHALEDDCRTVQP